MFLITVSTPSSNYRAVMERFKASGGLPLEGMRMVGRWHRTDGSGAVVVAEANDAKALAKWTRDWAGLITIETSPAVTDEDMAAVLSWQRRNPGPFERRGLSPDFHSTLNSL